MITLLLSEIPEDVELQRVCPYCCECELQHVGEDGLDYCEECGIVEGYIGKDVFRTEDDDLVVDDL